MDLTATSTNSNIRVLGQKNISQGKAYCWIQNKYHNWYNVMGLENSVPITPQSGTITFQMQPSTDYRVEWFSTYTGMIQSTRNFMSDAYCDVTVPVFGLRDDFAVIIKDPGVAPEPPQYLCVEQ